MAMTLSEKMYGLSEGVFKACLFLGLKFPPINPKEVQSVQEHMPSDYFGDDFELDAAIKKKLCAERKWTSNKLAQAYNNFSEYFLTQKCFPKHCKTDLNVFFCDYALFSEKKTGASANDYFDFEFYNKSFANQEEFRTHRHHSVTIRICNDPLVMDLATSKFKANSLFSNFLHRDWIYTGNCTFEEFKFFVEKHPRFFSKPCNGSLGVGAQIIKVDSNENLEAMFANLKSKNRLLEEIVSQHKDIAAICPDTLNTIRVYTLLDIHNVVHILATSGRFGRKDGTVDNFRGGGMVLAINPTTGIITSDGLNSAHERFEKHPDTGKTFKGFQYPCWEKVRAIVTKMAKMLPQLHHIGWDIAVNDKGEAILIEINGIAPGLAIQQAPDGIGRLQLYQPILDELQNYKREQMKLLGWRVNNLRDFDSSYKLDPTVWRERLKFTMTKLISPPTCNTLLDLGCRKEKFAKLFCPENVIYCPVDFKKHDDEVMACDFNNGEFPDLTADAILCTLTAGFVESLPKFLSKMCNAAQKQILMWCRPVDKEWDPGYRKYSFLTDFTEEFLIKTMRENNFELNAQYPSTKNQCIILYDFRKTSL